MTPVVPAPPVPLGVLDLVPISAGSGPATAVRNSVELAVTAESLGYSRYWFAEHHLNPGVAGTSPVVMIALAAGRTSTIRLGSGGVQSGHRTALSIVEEFGLLDAAHPGRIDLGIGRSGGRDFLKDRLRAVSSDGAPRKRRPNEATRTEDGLLIPARPSLKGLVNSPRLALTADMLQQRDAVTPVYTDLIGDVVSLLDGTYRSAGGLDPRPVPGVCADVEVWVLGSSAGESAAVAGALGLRFAANYHVSPSTILEAVDAYREAFVPSRWLDRPYVAVSADVVVGPDDRSAQEAAAGFGLWVLGIRSGQGASPYPTPDEAAAHPWTEQERSLVADRVDTQFVGSPAAVADGLRSLQRSTGADELVVTTATHDHGDRLRSYRLLAEEWFGADG
jgi:luciferase family oxidoreductase group 1